MQKRTQKKIELRRRIGVATREVLAQRLLEQAPAYQREWDHLYVRLAGEIERWVVEPEETS